MQLSPQKTLESWGGGRLVCALLLTLCWDQRLGEALIRGQTLSGGLAGEAGPPMILRSRHLICSDCAAEFFYGGLQAAEMQLGLRGEQQTSTACHPDIQPGERKGGRGPGGRLTSVSVLRLVAEITGVGLKGPVRKIWLDL